MNKRPEDTWTYKLIYKVRMRLNALPDATVRYVSGEGKMPFWLYAMFCIFVAVGVALVYILLNER